ncbi:hypothetical protein QRX50_31680 [Amycolatopsis carbonis]|uniref:Uncharacterized protein n=1 Tax=Amycolatopsis carbonis TaxID=715471 RepID=A0A9Y2IB41_9PSEU|nr:hypothetical protein [Amycolatopsis sp. 2-15]WIX76021.1 hypothetical protein QRX50_31680 [Amycolatopsis sp. 2-15]
MTAGEGVVVTGDGTPITNPYTVSLAHTGPAVDVKDTTTLDLSTQGQDPAVVSGDVRLSKDAGNALTTREDGLFVQDGTAAAPMSWHLLYQTKAQEIPDGTPTAINWDAIDDGPLFGPGIEIPWDGAFVFSMLVRVDVPAPVTRLFAWLGKAGDASVDARVSVAPPVEFPTANISPGITWTDSLVLKKGDVLALYFQQESGATRTTMPGRTNTRLSALYLGPA